MILKGAWLSENCGVPGALEFYPRQVDAALSESAIRFVIRADLGVNSCLFMDPSVIMFPPLYYIICIMHINARSLLEKSSLILTNPCSSKAFHSFGSPQAARCCLLTTKDLEAIGQALRGTTGWPFRPRFFKDFHSNSEH